MNDQKADLGGFLSGITYGIQPKPIFVLMHGPDGVGKSTWASHAPDPVFVGTETGSDQLPVARLPRPAKFGVFLDQLSGLANQEHPFKTIVIDSLDWLEPLIWRQACAEGQVSTIEDYGGGFGKGYVRALEIWRGTLDRLTDLARQFHVVLISHSRIERFDNPELPAGYDRYVVAIHDSAKASAAGAVRQAVDAVLFATFKEKVRQSSKKANENRGFGEAERVVYTEHRPAFDAKNRFELPFELPLEWKAFGEAVRKFYFGDPGQRLGGADGDREPGAAAVPESTAPTISQQLTDQTLSES